MKRLLCFLLAFTLCGCAYKTEIEQTAIVTGAALDKENGKIVLTVEVVDSKDQKAKGQIFTCKAESIGEASALMTSLTGRPLYWDHAKLIVVTEKFFEEEWQGLFEWLYRNSHARISTPIALCDFKGIFETENQGFISDTLLSLLNANKKNGGTVSSPAYLIYNSLKGKSETALLPLISIKEDKPVISGCGVFYKNKFRAKLNGAQTQTALILSNKFKGGNIKTDPAFFNITYADTNLYKTNGDIFIKARVKFELIEVLRNSKREKELLNNAKKELEQRTQELLAVFENTGADLLFFKERLNTEGPFFKISYSFQTNLEGHGQSTFKEAENEG